MSKKHPFKLLTFLFCLVAMLSFAVSSIALPLLYPIAPMNQTISNAVVMFVRFENDPTPMSDSANENSASNTREESAEVPAVLVVHALEVPQSIQDAPEPTLEIVAGSPTPIADAQEEFTADNREPNPEDDTPAQNGKVETVVRSVVIKDTGSGTYNFGDAITITSHLHGFPKQVEYQWQVKRDDGVWRNIHGANGDSYTFVFTNENCSFAWRLAVTDMGGDE